MIPAGPLRAPLDFQLGLADAIVVNNSPAMASHPSDVTGWLRQHFTGSVLSAALRPTEPISWLEGVAVVAYAGTGAPERFFALLTQLGAKVVHAVPFPDHHRFSGADAERLLELAARASALLVTTEKDWARLQGSAGSAVKLKNASRPLPVVMALEDRDLGRLIALLEMAIKSPGANAAGI